MASFLRRASDNRGMKSSSNPEPASASSTSGSKTVGPSSGATSALEKSRIPSFETLLASGSILRVGGSSARSKDALRDLDRELESDEDDEDQDDIMEELDTQYRNPTTEPRENGVEASARSAKSHHPYSGSGTASQGEGNGRNTDRASDKSSQKAAKALPELPLYNLAGGVTGLDRETQVARSAAVGDSTGSGTADIPPTTTFYTVKPVRNRNSSETGSAGLRTPVLDDNRSRGSSSNQGYYQSTTEEPTVASLAAAMESPRLRATSASSYVHIQSSPQLGRQRTESSTTTRSPDAKTRTAGLGIEHQQPQVARMESHVSSSGTVTTVSSNASRGSGGTRRQRLAKRTSSDGLNGSSAFRKTSGFFRRTFGLGSGDGASASNAVAPVSTARPVNGSSRTYSNSSASAPSTPVTGRFDTSSAFTSQNQPPVPSLPSAYAPAHRQSFSNDSNYYSPPQTINTRVSSSTPPSSYTDQFTSTPTRSGNRDSKRSTTSTLHEQDQLRRELEYWKATEDTLADRQEELLQSRQQRDQIAEEDDNVDFGATIRGPRSASAGAPTSHTSRTSVVPQTPPRLAAAFSQMSYDSPGNRSHSSPGAFVASASPAMDRTDTVLVSGSIPSPTQATVPRMRAGNDIRLDSESSNASASTLHAGADSSNTTIGDASPTARSRGHSNASDAIRTQSPRVEGSPAMLESRTGKQVRRRADSTTYSSPPAPVAGSVPLQQRPSISSSYHTLSANGQLLSTPDMKAVPQKAQNVLGSASPQFSNASSSPRMRTSERLSGNTGLGLGLSAGGAQSVTVPRLTTQSPSPAHQQIFSQDGHSSNETARLSSSPNQRFSPNLATGVNMYPISASNSPSLSRTPTVKTPKLGIVTAEGDSTAPNGHASPGMRSTSSSQLSPNSAVTGVASDLPLESRAKLLAEKCWNEDETFLKKDKIAEWLGGHQELNHATLAYYVEYLDLANSRIDIAFRKLCEKLYLRAETQQVDRILVAFSHKYYDDNPDTIFKTPDIIHATTYAMLLLNTDLHVADVANRMSRSDFVYNTMSAIRAQATSPPLGGFRTPASSHTPTMDAPDEYFSEERDATQRQVSQRTSMEKWRDAVSTTPRIRSKRSGSGSVSASSSRAALNDLANFGGSTSNLPNQSPSTAGAGVRPVTIIGDLPVKSNSVPSMSTRAWDMEIENLLKEVYNAIRAKPIMQPLEYSSLAIPGTNSNGSSPYSSWNAVSRTPSRRSQTSVGPDRTPGYKRASLRGFLGASHDSTRASSPTPSVGTSMSTGNTSFGSIATNATSFYPASMGFASNLSHSIIREQQEEDARSDSSDVSTTDEELALLGAPWAKEGILQRKHYWENANRRSKDKNWLSVFAVIEKGEMKMFQFGGSNLGSARSNGGLGGGDWLSNAQLVGEVSLAHSLCSAMPPPGYNRQRPHVLVLTLPNGGSYFFQAGTEDLVNEWVLTCNYWAGRTSKEPLMGGVSNMDNGWNRILAGTSPREQEVEDLMSVRSGRSTHSHRSRMSSYAGSIGRHSLAGTMTSAHGDRTTLHDWAAPQPPKTTSQLSEEAQLKSLRQHTATLQTELERHNELRQPMMRLYAPRSVNANKALTNWEKKSKYLLAELVKYQTYVDALKVARRERQKKKDEKKVNRLLEEADDGASLNDPVYSPPPMNTTTFSAQQDTMGLRDDKSEDQHAEVVRLSNDSSASQPKQNGVFRRASSGTTTASTINDYYEADEARTEEN